MIGLAAVFSTSFMIALSGALMPGPLFTVTVSESAARGFKAGPLLITGHAFLELALVVAICIGLDTYLKIPLVMSLTALLGGLVLIMLGIGMVRSAPGLSLQQSPEKRAGLIVRNPVFAGAIASIANPYWIIWWTTFGLGYLTTISHLGVMGVAAFFSGHIAADFAWYSMISLGISRGRTLMSDRTYRHLIRICGLLLLLFGLWFVTSAFPGIGQRSL